MNASVPAVKPQLTAGAQVAALVPQTLEEAFRVATAIAASNLAPRGLEKPEQILVAIMAGAELGFAPFQALQSFAVVNNRPTLWGDGLVAIIRRNGCSIREWHEGETAFCEITRPDTGETITRSFSQADALKAGLAGKTGPWQQYPQRMRAMRARAWAGRDGCADMLRGFQIAEEVQDYDVRTVREVMPQGTGMLAKLEGRKASTAGFDAEHIARETGAPTHDTETGEVRDLDEVLDGDQIPSEGPAEVIDAEVGPAEPEQVAEPATEAPAATEGPTTAQIAAMYEERLRGATNTTKLQSLRTANTKLRERLDAADPERLAELEALFNERFAELEDAERGAGQ